PHSTLRALEGLARGDVVASSVVTRLALDETPRRLHDRTSVSADDARGFLRIGYDDADPLHGRRVAQELALAFAQLVHDRFGARVAVDVVEPVHTLADPSSPHAVRNLLAGAIAGALAGAAGAAAIARARARAAR